MRHFLETLLCLLIVAMTGCAGTSGTPNLPSESASGKGPGPSVLIGSYQMGVGDKVSVNVWENPELSIETPVRPDGKIAMPLIGEVMAAGKEPKQLAEDITAKLKAYVKYPNVTVMLTSIKGQEFLSRIRVTGSVEKDVSIEYQQGMTVLDAILEAGGLDLYANANGTKLHRKTEQGTQTFDIRVKDIMEKGDMKTNILLMPGDIITVPERFF
ncbi:polysaccharide export outer membrane protein [Thiogranum longum]|uniref:Polysaccharide export outer membrane protein n=2 Tax=Thiogranum longum TaxID=1537524 RepID=A0A4V2PGU8_9GAMM|nr:polysaccharide export outer membrane protein [Thiogranum longum]